MAGQSHFFSENEYKFPVPLIEIDNQTIIERVITNLSTAADNINYIFVVNAEHCKKYHLDNTLKIITKNKCQIIQVDSKTKGAACSVLIAIDYIENNQKLIISNNDQILNVNISTYINQFDSADAGVVTFNSVHPRWSYVLVNENQEVMEACEKNPISRNAIAGFYYFKNGFQYTDAAKEMIKKNDSYENEFYISPVINQMILKGLSVKSLNIENHNYHTFYTPQKIKEYEAWLNINK